MKVVIEEISFPEPGIFPMVADVHYSLKGRLEDLRGSMRLPVPAEFIESITKQATEILKERINLLP
jgi:hypothetical protein